MGELLGGALFGWLWVGAARLLLLPFSPATRRAWVIPLTLIIVVVLGGFAVNLGAIANLSPLTLLVMVASLAFFLQRTHARNVREAEEEASPPKRAAAPRPAAPAATASGEGTFEVTDESNLPWRVDLDSMTLTHGEDRYRLRRTSEGAWQVRDAGEAWESLEQLDGHLATVIDTRWRRYVRG